MLALTTATFIPTRQVLVNLPMAIKIAHENGRIGMTVYQPASRYGHPHLRCLFKSLLLMLALLIQPLFHASAYNQDTHALLVDYAWQVLLTIDTISRGDAPQDQPFQPLTVSTDFAGRAQQAVRKIHALPA